jgi:fibronectin-binding autotransporter adhesin
MNNTLGRYVSVSLKALLITSSILLATQLAKAQGTTTWSGLGADQNWSTAGNWSTSGGSTPPGTTDNVIFGNGAFPASTNVVGATNNIITSSTTVGTLSYLNISPNTHTTQINAGQTLTVNGTLTVGAASSTATMTMTGAGNLTVNNLSGNVNIGSGGTEQITFTLPNGNVSLNVGTLSIGESGSVNGRNCIVNLGAGPTVINADTNSWGTGKGSGLLRWLPATTNGTLVIRGSNGVSRSTLLWGNGTSGSGASHGALYALGHQIDVLASSVTMGGNTGTDSGSTCGGTNVFDWGTFDATSILMANSTSANSSAKSFGYLTVGGSSNTTTLIVNSPTGPGGGSFLISDATSTVATGAGTLAVSNNGTAQIYTSIVKTKTALNTASIFVVGGGTLNMEGATNTIGTPAVPIDVMTLDNANLTFGENGSALNAAVLALTLNETNIFTITSLPVISSIPTVIPVITYTSITSDGNQSNLVLNPLPGGYSGYLSNDNTAAISLVITNGTVSTKADTWAGVNTNAWDTATFNWTNASSLVKYGEGDTVTFDDTGKTNNVNITAPHSPGSVTVNNTAVNYTFSGAGSINGLAGLTKSGSGSLTLAETGGDGFVGGINVHGGSLILDNGTTPIPGNLTNDANTVVQIGNNDTNGTLPSGNIVINGSLVFRLTNNVTVSAAISGTGTLTQGGTNTLILTNVSSYSGNTIVTNGTLSPRGGASFSSPLFAVQNSTLDISRMVSASLSAVTLTNGVLNVGRATNTPTLNSLALSNSTITLSADYTSINTAMVTVSGAFTTGGTTNMVNVTAIRNLPLSPTLPFDVVLVSYGSANFSGGFNIGWTNLPGISGYITNNTATTLDLIVTNAPQSLTWNGGSATDNNWSDAANWNNVGIVALDALTFDGLLRTNNFNDTPAGTTYVGITFNNSAGDAPFKLTGNPINVTGTIFNNSADVQTVALGLLANGACTNDGGTSGGSLVLSGSITNSTTNSQTVAFLNNGTVSDVLWSTNNGTNGGGVLTLLMAGNGEWAMVDGTGSGSQVAAENVQISVSPPGASTTAVFDFGTTNSSPNLDTGYPSNGVVTINGPSSGSSTATFNMNNGTLKANAMNLGNSGTVNGFVNFNGGTVILGPGSLSMGGGNGATAMVGTVTNGALYSTNGGTLTLAQRGSGTLTLSGGLVQCGALSLTTGGTASGIGTLNLMSGGLLICTNINVGSSSVSGWGTVNYNGGILKMGGSSTAFFKQSNFVPLTNIVQSGGAIIDTAGFNDTFNWPFLTDPSLGGAQDGGLTKLGNGTLTLSAVNTYIGNTEVGAGTLLVNGSLAGGAVTVSNNATLGGSGVIGSNVTVNAGGTLAPGNNAIGTLTVAGDVSLNGTTTMEINKVGPSNDLLLSTNATPSTITYGGTLNVVLLSGSYTATDTFKLFSASNYVGAFTSLTPATPGAGLAWNTNTLNVDGILRLVASGPSGPTTNVTITKVTLSGTNMLIHGTNNNVPNNTFHFVALGTANITNALSNWTPLMTNTYNTDGTFDYTNPIVPGVPRQFIDIEAIP